MSALTKLEQDTIKREIRLKRNKELQKFCLPLISLFVKVYSCVYPPIPALLIITYNPATTSKRAIRA
jgi:hypothetical protein